MLVSTPIKHPPVFEDRWVALCNHAQHSLPLIQEICCIRQSIIILLWARGRTVKNAACLALEYQLEYYTSVVYAPGGQQLSEGSILEQHRLLLHQYVGAMYPETPCPQCLKRKICPTLQPRYHVTVHKRYSTLTTIICRQQRCNMHQPRMQSHSPVELCRTLAGPFSLEKLIWSLSCVFEGLASAFHIGLSGRSRVSALSCPMTRLT